MARTKHRIKLGLGTSDPEVDASVRLGRAQRSLHELRKHYPDAYILGVHESDGGRRGTVLTLDMQDGIEQSAVRPNVWEN